MRTAPMMLSLQGVIYSFPVTCKDGKWAIVQVGCLLQCRLVMWGRGPCMWVCSVCLACCWDSGVQEQVAGTLTAF